MSAAAGQSMGVGGTNLTIDIMEGCKVILARRNGNPGGAIVKIHLFTPLKLEMKCSVTDGTVYLCELEIGPSAEMEKMSSFPKIITPELQRQLEEAFQAATVQTNEECMNYGIGNLRPARLATMGELSIQCKHYVKL